MRRLLSNLSNQRKTSACLFEEIKQGVGWMADCESVKLARYELRERYKASDFADAKSSIDGNHSKPVADLEFHFVMTEEAKAINSSGRFLKSKTSTRIELDDLFRDVRLGGGERDIEVQRYFNSSTTDSKFNLINWSLLAIRERGKRFSVARLQTCGVEEDGAANSMQSTLCQSETFRRIATMTPTLGKGRRCLLR